MTKNTRGILFTLIGAVLWGFCGVCGKYLLEYKGFNAPYLVTFRLVISGIMLLVISFTKYRDKTIQIWTTTTRSKIEIIVFGLIGMCMCQLTYFLAIQYSNAATATSLQYTGPVMIMVISLIAEKRAPSIKEVVVLIMIILGVYLLSTHGKFGSLSITKKALIYGILAAVGLVVYSLEPRRLLKEYGSIPTVGWGMLIGGLALSIHTKPWIPQGVWDIETLVFLAAVVVGGTTIAFTAYLEGVRLIGATKASLIACVEPLVSTLLSVVITGSIFTSMDIVGMILIVAGVAMLSIKAQEKTDNVVSAGD